MNIRVPAGHEAPHDDAIWRYMDLAQYVSMLQQGGILFVAVAQLEDKSEGTLSEAQADGLRALLKHAGFESEHHPLMGAFAGLESHMLRCGVSCWHRSDAESVAMWRVYGGEGKGVAVRSTFGALRECLDTALRGKARAAHTLVGEVKYGEPPPRLNWGSTSQLFLKRVPFASEAEVRALTVTDDEGESCWLAVDLVRLVSEVVVSPFQPKWFLDTVRDVTKQYEPALGNRVRESEISEQIGVRFTEVMPGLRAPSSD